MRGEARASARFASIGRRDYACARRFRRLEGQPRVVRLAVLHDGAVDAVRTRDAARIAAAVKELDDEYDGGKDVTFAPMVARLPREIETLRALVAGRATIGDACKDRRK